VTESLRLHGGRFFVRIDGGLPRKALVCKSIDSVRLALDRITSAVIHSIVRNRRNPRRARNRVLKIKRHILLSLISRVMMKNLYLRVLLFLLSLISREINMTRRRKADSFPRPLLKITHQSVRCVWCTYKNKIFTRAILSNGIFQSMPLAKIAKIVLLWNSFSKSIGTAIYSRVSKHHLCIMLKYILFGRFTPTYLCVWRGTRYGLFSHLAHMQPPKFVEEVPVDQSENSDFVDPVSAFSCTTSLPPLKLGDSLKFSWFAFTVTRDCIRNDVSFWMTLVKFFFNLMVIAWKDQHKNKFYPMPCSLNTRNISKTADFLPE